MARGLGVVAAQMDEREAYTNLSEALGIAEAACRQLAFMRAGVGGGALWLQMAAMMGKTRHQASILAQASATKIGGMVRQ
jgi:hypothetical protein